MPEPVRCRREQRLSTRARRRWPPGSKKWKRAGSTASSTRPAPCTREAWVETCREELGNRPQSGSRRTPRSPAVSAGPRESRRCGRTRWSRLRALRRPRRRRLSRGSAAAASAPSSKVSGRRRRAGCGGSACRRASGALSSGSWRPPNTTASSSIDASTRFIAGEPMKDATKRLRGSA